MTQSIDKRLEALDILVNLLSQIDVSARPILCYGGEFMLKLEDKSDEPFEFIITRDQLEALQEVLVRIK